MGKVENQSDRSRKKYLFDILFFIYLFIDWGIPALEIFIIKTYAVKQYIIKRKSFHLAGIHSKKFNFIYSLATRV